MAAEPIILPSPDKKIGLMIPAIDTVTNNNPAHIETNAKLIIR